MDETDEIEAIGEKAGHYARAVIDETETAGEIAEQVLASIRARPFKSALIALGAGAIFGFLIRNRD